MPWKLPCVAARTATPKDDFRIALAPFTVSKTAPLGSCRSGWCWAGERGSSWQGQWRSRRNTQQYAHCAATHRRNVELSSSPATLPKGGGAEDARARSAYPPKLSVKADIPAQQPSAIKRRSPSGAIPTWQMIFPTTRLAPRAGDHSDNSDGPHRMRRSMNEPNARVVRESELQGV